MSWIAIALIAAAVSAVVSIFDKTVIHRYATSPLTLPLIIGIAQTAVGLTVLAVVRTPPEASAEAVGWAVGSGVLFGLGGQILIRTLFTMEVSRTIPVYQTFPVFAALIAVVFLDEVVTPSQWVAIGATVAGAAALSVRTGAGYKTLFLHRAFFVLMVGSLLNGAAHVTGKAAVDELPILYTHGLRMLALGLVFLSFNLRAVPLREVAGFVRDRSPALLFVGANELVIANVSLLLTLWALSLGPVSLVSALIGTRALYVVVFSTGLALVWKGALGEETSRQAVAVKVGATAVIVAGVAGIAL